MADRSSVRLVHVTTVHSPDDNRIFYKECVALRKAGYDVTLIATSDGDEERDGVHIRAIPRRARLSRMIFGPLDVWKILRKQSATLVHLHDPELIPLGILWRLWAPGVVVFDAHENLEAQFSSKSYLPRWTRGLAAAFGRMLEAVVNFGLDGVVIALPEWREKFSRRPVVAVQNYPWLSSFPTASDFKATGKFVYVGSLSWARGVREMLESIERTRSRSELAIAGPAQDAEIGRALGNSVRTNYNGPIPPDEIPEFVACGIAGLALLHPSPNYLASKPTKVFEYMAAGRAFIASDIPYWIELLGDEAGIFVNPKDPVEVVSAMDRLLEDPELARTMGQNGRRAFENAFTFEGEARRLVNFVDVLSGQIQNRRNAR